jgi:hypothetical protein
LTLKVTPGVANDGPKEQLDAKEHAAVLANNEHRQDLDGRKEFSTIALGIMQSWVGFLFVIVLAQFSLSGFGMGLKQAEFIAVVTTTTAAVFGFGLLVGGYLFPKGGSDRRSSK